MKKFFFVFLILLFIPVISLAISQEVIDYLQEVDCQAMYQPDVANQEYQLVGLMNCYYNKAVITNKPDLCYEINESQVNLTLNLHLTIDGCMKHQQAFSTKNVGLCIELANEHVQIDCFNQILDENINEICNKYADYGGNENSCKEYLQRRKDVEKRDERASFVASLENNKPVKYFILIVTFMLPVLGILLFRKERFNSKIKLYLYSSSIMAILVLLLYLLLILSGSFAISFFVALFNSVGYFFTSWIRTNSFLEIPISFLVNGLVGGICYSFLLASSNKKNKLTKIKEMVISPLAD